jgi:glycosyltransferase involved in cell wall biosynthesis
MKPRFSILITTKDRIEDLKFTLLKIGHLLERDDVELIVIDDGSNDGTFEYLKIHYPACQVLRNESPKGLIHNRNVLNQRAKGEFLISLDDDLHFLTHNPLDIIEQYFNENQQCAVISFRIFWSKQETVNHFTAERATIVNSFAGGAHSFRKSIWEKIPNYPEWYEFYGEETFASLQLFKKQFEIHYVPEVLVQHRVELKSRALDSPQYSIRLKRHLRADWFNFFLLYPPNALWKSLFYSIKMKCKSIVLDKNHKLIKPFLLAVLDLIVYLPKLIKNRQALTKLEFEKYRKLKPAKIYWQPEK